MVNDGFQKVFKIGSKSNDVRFLQVQMVGNSTEETLSFQNSTHFGFALSEKMLAQRQLRKDLHCCSKRNHNKNNKTRVTTK